MYGPYTGRWFASPRDTDIEHIVARSEAHDSGLCAADAASQRRVASDLLNLTLASPAVNRTHKNDKDAAAWLPDLNQCWFADRVVAVRRKFGLTIDPREAARAGSRARRVPINRDARGAAARSLDPEPHAAACAVATSQ